MESIIRDARFALRRLIRKPLLSAVIIVTLALCIGTTSALFSVVRAIFLDPFPYEGHERIVLLSQHFPTLERDQFTFSVPELLELEGQRHVFDALSANRGRDVNLTGDGPAERVQGVEVSASLFTMLGVPPQLGRTFTEAEDRPGVENLVVISHRLWQNRFASDPKVVGHPLEIDGVAHTVLGVMPQRFLWWDSDVWFPLALDRSATDRADRSVVILARLQEGLTPEAAQNELAGFAERLESEHRAELPEYENLRFEMNPLLDQVIRNVRPALRSLLWAVGCLLLIACTNIANLQLAQAVSREREVAVRTALGADRGHIVRQLVVENLLLAMAGGVGGYFLASWGTRLIVGLIPYGFFPAETEVTLDHWALGFSLAIGILAGFFFGLAPAVHLTRRGILGALKDGGRSLGGGRGARFLRRVLVVSEVALALIVVFGAALMIRSFTTLTDVEMGFRPEGAVTMRVELPSTRYGEPHQVETFYRHLEERLSSLPGVQAAGLTYTLPLSGGPVQAVSLDSSATAESATEPESQIDIVSPGWFGAMGANLRAGRVFDHRDVAEAQPAAIVNAAFARRFFPGRSVLGQQVRWGTEADGRPWMTIVGVIDDVLQEELDVEARQALFIPFSQSPTKPRGMALVLRTPGDPEAMIELVRREVEVLDPELPVFGARTLKQLVLETLGGRQLTVVLLALFAVLALLLAAVGIFGVIAHGVNQRLQELGVRMALGADRGDLRQLVVSQGLRMAGVGVLFGVMGALVASRLLASLVYGVSTKDPLTLATVSLLFVLIAMVASYLPARRASRVDPVTVLREE